MSLFLTLFYDHYNEETAFVIEMYKEILWGLAVRVPGYRSRGPGSTPGATRFSSK
jgi:hypothetical protein